MRQFAPLLPAGISGLFSIAAATAPLCVVPQAHAAGQLLDPGWQVVGQPAPAGTAGGGFIQYIFSDAPGEVVVAPAYQPPPVTYYQLTPAQRRRLARMPYDQAAPQMAPQAAPQPAANYQTPDYQASAYQPVPPPQAPMLTPQQPLYQQAQPVYQQDYQQAAVPEPAPQYAVQPPPQGAYQPVPPPQAPAYQPTQPEPRQLAFQGSAGAGAVYNMAHQPINPIYERQLVGYQGNEKPGTILIDTPHFFLYLVLDGGRAIRYGIGVGRPGFTWAGVKQVSAKREWPDWIPPVEMLQRRPDLPRHMPGGPNNPLGARAMYLGSSLYRIHGSNEPWSIGTQVSSGCIRLRNEDVIDLYERVKVGAKVVVM
jgi:lipoprotein-anchoring transpeptidase ErfK/SrfK